jgi:nitronate monooxygenase
MAPTRLMQMLGMSVPIIAAPLGRGVTPPFLGAMHDAGGLGFIGLTHFSPADIPALLAPIAAATDGHFGVNLSLIADKRGQLRSALAAGARIVSLWQDNPAEYVQIAKDAGAVVLWTVGSPQEAARARAMGVDIVVAQGAEAGGHLVGKAPTMTHLAAIVAAAEGLPVAAAGGIADGPGLAAALTLGAEAAWLGTRFVASTEAALHEGYKGRVVAAGADDAVETRLYDIGWPDSPHRVLRNETIAAWERAGRPPPGARPGEGDIVGHHPDGTPSLRYHIGSATTGFEGDWAATPMYAGTSVQFVHDVQPVSAIIGTLMRDAAQAAQRASLILQPAS